MTMEDLNTTEDVNRDTWLRALRSEPSPLFRTQLRERLRAQEPVRASPHNWLRRPLLAAAAVAVAAVLISVPGVRASVAQFVALFRVTRVVPVAVDVNRLQQLKAENLEISTLIGEHVHVLQDPGPPLTMSSVEEAAQASGMTLATPQWLPEKTTVLETRVIGERAVRVTADSRRLQQVMDALGIRDLTVPQGLHGQYVDVRVPPVAIIRYDHPGRSSRLVQARSPQLGLPPGIQLQALGEIGLRILGVAPMEAKQFAQAIDWHSTLIVPVPASASSFRQVVIGGNPGMMIQHRPPNGALTYGVVWSTAERVFVLQSTLNWDQVLAMADSIH